jgi:hypothetical protein
MGWVVWINAIICLGILLCGPGITEKTRKFFLFFFWLNFLAVLPDMARGIGVLIGRFYE